MRRVEPVGSPSPWASCASRARTAVDPGAGPRLRRDRGGRAAAVRRPGRPRPRRHALRPADLDVERRRAAAARRDAPGRDRALPVGGRPRRARLRRDRRRRGRRAAVRRLHDHTGYAALAMADRLRTPSSTRCTGPFDADNRDFYATHGHKATLVAISRAQAADAPAEAGPCAVVHNPLAFDEWPSARAAATTSCGSGAWRRQGAAARDRGGARRRGAARARGAGAAGPGGVLRRGGRAARRRRRGPLRGRGRRGGQAEPSSATRARCSCRSAGASRSAWSWSRRWPAARRSSPSPRARSRRSSPTA